MSPTSTKKSTRTSSNSRGLAGAAADAMQELSEAVRGLQKSWDHITNAQEKARPATRAITRLTKKVGRKVHRTTSRMTSKTRR